MPTSASVRLFSTVLDSKCGSPFIQPIVLGRWWRAQWTTSPYSDGLRFIVRDSMGDKAVLNNLCLVHPQCPVLHSHNNLFAQLHWLPSANTLKVPESFARNLYPLFLVSHNYWEDSDQISWKVIYNLVYNLSSSNCINAHFCVCASLRNVLTTTSWFGCNRGKTNLNIRR